MPRKEGIGFSHLATVEILRSVYNSYSTLANQLLSPLGLTFSQCEILFLLYQRSPEIVETSELLQITQIAPSSLSYTTKKLKQYGYVDFIRNGDQRKKQIRLTPKAFEVQGKITEVFQFLENTFFFQMTDTECKVVKAVLYKITQNISCISAKNNSIYNTALNDPSAS